MEHSPETRETIVELAPHDGRWPSLFEGERTRIHECVSRHLVAIEHIGSTAVPALDAKPVVDILVGTRGRRGHRDVIDALARELDYCEEGHGPQHAWLTWPSPDRRTFNVHVVSFEGPVWNARIAFRDALRESGGVRAEYLDLKRSLAAAHTDDLNAYTRGKRQFVEATLVATGVNAER